MTKQFDTQREAIRNSLNLNFKLKGDGVPVAGARPNLVHSALIAQGWKDVPLPEQKEWPKYLHDRGFQMIKAMNARGIGTTIVTARAVKEGAKK